MPASVSSPLPALRVVLDGDVLPAVVSPGLPLALVEALKRLEDPRWRRGVRHRLITIVLVAVGAVLTGARSYAAIADWAADLDQPTRAGLGLRGVPPPASTIRRLLQAVDPAALEAALSAWAWSRRDQLAVAA